MLPIGQLIKQKLHEQERSVTWFARKLHYERTNVYKLFQRESIDTLLLLRISHILHYNFFRHYVEEYTLSLPAEPEEEKVESAGKNES